MKKKPINEGLREDLQLTLDAKLNATTTGWEQVSK